MANTSIQKLKEQVDEYLQSGKLMQLATSINDNLWMCHVWYSYNAELNEIYFTSNKSRRHSKEINTQPNVSGGIIAIELEGLGQKVQGITFEGIAKEASTIEDIEKAYKGYSLKWQQVKDMFSAQDIIQQATNMRMYIVSLKRIVLFDEINYPDSPKQELVI